MRIVTIWLRDRHCRQELTTIPISIRIVLTHLFLTQTNTILFHRWPNCKHHLNYSQIKPIKVANLERLNCGDFTCEIYVIYLWAI